MSYLLQHINENISMINESKTYKLELSTIGKILNFLTGNHIALAKLLFNSDKTLSRYIEFFLMDIRDVIDKRVLNKSDSIFKSTTDVTTIDVKIIQLLQNIESNTHTIRKHDLQTPDKHTVKLGIDILTSVIKLVDIVTKSHYTQSDNKRDGYIKNQLPIAKETLSKYK
jgi:hypothetical protein